MMNYLPDNQSSQLHLEKVDSKTSFPTLAMRDVTYMMTHQLMAQ